MIDKKLNGKDIISVPLAEESEMHIGYITHRKGMVSRLGISYLKALEKYTDMEHSEKNLSAGADLMN